MPQITVDYSAVLAEGFDRPAFAKALHEEVVRTAAAKPRGVQDAVPGHRGHGGRRRHGRPRDRARHARAARRADRRDQGDADRDRAGAAPGVREVGQGLALHASAEVRDLDPSYRKFEGWSRSSCAVGGAPGHQAPRQVAERAVGRLLREHSRSRPAISSSWAALTATRAAKSWTSWTSSSRLGIRRPSSQIRAVDSAREIQERMTSSRRAGGVLTSRCERIWTYAAWRTPSMRAFVREEPTAGPPRISAEKPGPCSSTKSKKRRVTRSSRAPSGPSRGSTKRCARSSEARCKAASYRLSLPGK